MHSLTSTFLRGLGVVLPIALTAYLVFWMATTAESLLKPLFGLLFPTATTSPAAVSCSLSC